MPINIRKDNDKAAPSKKKDERAIWRLHNQLLRKLHFEKKLGNYAYK